MTSIEALTDPHVLAERLFAGGKARGVDVELRQVGRQLSSLQRRATIWFGYEDRDIMVRCRDDLGTHFCPVNVDEARAMVLAIDALPADTTSTAAVEDIYRRKGIP